MYVTRPVQLVSCWKGSSPMASTLAWRPWRSWPSCPPTPPSPPSSSPWRASAHWPDWWRVALSESSQPKHRKGRSDVCRVGRRIHLNDGFIYWRALYFFDLIGNHISLVSTTTEYFRCIMCKLYFFYSYPYIFYKMLFSSTQLMKMQYSVTF